MGTFIVEKTEEIDSGNTTYHNYDALKRRFRSNRQGVTTETGFNELSTDTHRYAEVLTVGSNTTLGGAPGNLIGRETRNLAGTLPQSETPSPTRNPPSTLILSNTTRIQYSPASGISRRVTTTVPGNHTQTEDFDLLGRNVKSTGALSPAMAYAYTPCRPLRNPHLAGQ